MRAAALHGINNLNPQARWIVYRQAAPTRMAEDAAVLAEGGGEAPGGKDAPLVACDGGTTWQVMLEDSWRQIKQVMISQVKRLMR